MDIKGVWHSIRANWWIVVLGLVIGAGLATWVNLSTAKQYQSTVQFFVSTPNTGDQGANAGDQFATKRVNSYAKLLSSESFARTVLDDSGVKMGVTDLTHKITGSASLNTVLLTATVTDTSKDRSFQIAKSIAAKFPSTVSALENRGTVVTVLLNVVSGPTLHDYPVAPKTKLNLAIGILLGLLLGIAIAIMRRLLDTTVHSIDILREVGDAPVIGTIAFDNTTRKEPLIVGAKAHSIRAESMRQLRTNLQFIDVDRPIHVMVVTSALAGEGKSTCAANLALVFAETGRRVLIIEADLRRPLVTDYLGMERIVGLTNVLAGQAEFRDVVQPFGDTGLWVLPSGFTPPNPSEMLGSQNMIDLMTELRRSFDVIIIDTPPLLPVTDGVVAAKLADGVVIVVRHGKTRRTQLTATRAALDSVDARVLGTVFNMMPTRGPGARDSYHGYGYRSVEPPPASGATAPVPTPSGSPAAPAPTDPEGANAVVVVPPASVAPARPKPPTPARRGGNRRPNRGPDSEDAARNRAGRKPDDESSDSGARGARPADSNGGVSRVAGQRRR